MNFNKKESEEVINHTEWKNEPSLKDLMKDFDSSQTSFENQKGMVEESIAIMNEDYGNARRKVSGRKTSNHNSQLVKKQYEWIVPNIEEPVLGTETMFSLSPLDYRSAERESLNSDVLNYQWNNQLRRNELINKSSRKFVEEGMCILRVGWSVKERKTKVYSDKVVYSTDEKAIRKAIDEAMSKDQEVAEKMIQMFEAGEEVPIGVEKVSTEKNVAYENKPTISVLNYNRVIIDPSSKGERDKINFIIEIVETNFAALQNQSKDSGGSYFNLDYVKKYIEEAQESDEIGNETPFIKEESDYDFQFSDLARKKITMYTYWGYWDIENNGKLEPIVSSWIGSKLVRLEKSPYPFYSLPYAIGTFLPVENSFIGKTNAMLLESDQRALTNAIRAMQDITDESATGQEFINEDLFATPLEKKAYENGRTVYLKRGSNLKDMMHRKSVEPVPEVLFQMKDMYERDSTNMTGAIDGDSVQNRMTQSQTGQQVPLDSISNRENAILRRFTTMFGDASSMILAMNKAYLQKDTVYKKDDKVKIIGNTDDLSDMYEVKSTIETRRMKDDKASKLISMLHNGSASMSPTLAAQHYLKIAELWNYKDLVHIIRDDMNREPTEEEQMQKQIAMEREVLTNKKMKMDMLVQAKEIEYKDSRMREILVGLASGSMDAEVLKTKAQAELYMAETGKMNSQIQLFDQEFALIGDGTKREEKKEDNEYKHLADLEREEVRTERELQNINAKEAMSSKDKNVEYIRDGTLHNQSYNPEDDIFRNILDKNSLDTSKYTKPKKDVTEDDIIDIL